jgi:hypothetical protein
MENHEGTAELAGMDLVFQPKYLAVLRHLRQQSDSRANIEDQNEKYGTFAHPIRILLKLGFIRELERPLSSINPAKQSGVQPYAITEKGLKLLEQYEKKPEVV